MNFSRRHFIGTVSAALGASAFVALAKPKTIVLQSAWATHNIGDIGHTPGTLRVIEQHLPDVKVVLWAMQLDERVTAMLRARFPKVEIVRGSLVKESPDNEPLLAGFSEYKHVGPAPLCGVPARMRENPPPFSSNVMSHWPSTEFAAIDGR